MNSRLLSAFTLLLSAALILAACSSSPPASPVTNGPGSQSTSGASEPDGEIETTAREEEPTRPVVARIAIRQMDGVGKFYDTGTGETFVPRGVNYVDFYPTGRGSYEDRVMATNVYDPERVRTAFKNLAAYGYNTVRIFIDTCGFGPYCIGNPNGPGLNPAYLDNLVDLMRIAGEEGIYVIFTANSVPEEGGYWIYFDEQVNERDQRFGFDSYQNADWLHPAGLEIKRRFWQDLMSGLVEREALFESVLGWQLTNELWLWKNVPPLSLEEGLVMISNEQTYDMSDPEQKRQMVVDGILLYIEAIDAIIKEHDPQALTTVGFFAPQFPNETGIGGEWYVDTAPLVRADAAVDFWDFHAYYDSDLEIEAQAENFGMIGREEKPVVMGETGSGQAFFPSAYAGLTRGLQWIADSCAVGFDGWLNWGYYPWPEDLGGKPWTFLDEDGLLLEAMAPISQPDACVVPELERANVALDRPVRYSRQLPEEPASAAVNGQETAWSAGDYPPQWIEIQLDGPTTVGRVGMTISQWPPGDTRHQVWATLAEGTRLLIAEFNGFTGPDMALAHELPTPLSDVVAVRILTLESPSWVGWGEVEVISVPPAPREACSGAAQTAAAIYARPDTSSAPLGRLDAGDQVLLDGYERDENGQEWLRVGGGTWLEAAALSLSGDCSPEALPGEALARTSPVTFRLNVPESTEGEIFIGGSFPGTQIPSWNPYTILLQPQGGRLQATVDLPVGAQIEYLYTRGGWERVERSAACMEIPNRRLVVGAEAMLVEDTVVAWQDLDCGS